MPAKKKKAMLSQSRLREIAWEVGQNYPVTHSSDYISLFMITPGLGHVHWNVRERTVNALFKKKKIAGKPTPVVLIHDVSDIIFDGANSHSHFELQVHNNKGHYTFGHDRCARHYIAELGLRSGGSFHSVALSEAVFFNNDRLSGNYSTAGLFSGGMLHMTFPVENIFDAPVYERMNADLSSINRNEALSIAVINVAVNGDSISHIGSYIDHIAKGFRKFGSRATLFTQKEKEALHISDKSILKSIGTISETIYAELAGTHREKSFHLLHCHDWYSSQAGIEAKKKLKLPLVLSLHSTEYERTNAGEIKGLSKKISAIEKKAVKAADLVIVPHSYTRQQVTGLYDARPEKVVIIPDVMDDNHSDHTRFSSEARQWFSIPAESSVVLFSGEMSHAAGADLIIESLPTVCRNHRTSHFILVGEGPLKGELEARTHHMGVSHRCHFTGHLSGKAFESVLRASDFVVVPARSWQDEGLAQMAIEYGKPVLATHQSGVTCIEHGKNGLVTFDNPGSIVWGIQELLHNPLKDSMLRAAARKSAGQSRSLESITALHYMYYEIVLNRNRESKHD